jgi:hypothetical protein
MNDSRGTCEKSSEYWLGDYTTNKYGVEKENNQTQGLIIVEARPWPGGLLSKLNIMTRRAVGFLPLERSWIPADSFLFFDQDLRQTQH